MSITIRASETLVLETRCFLSSLSFHSAQIFCFFVISVSSVNNLNGPNKLPLRWTHMLLSAFGSPKQMMCRMTWSLPELGGNGVINQQTSRSHITVSTEPGLRFRLVQVVSLVRWPYDTTDVITEIHYHGQVQGTECDHCFMGQPIMFSQLVRVGCSWSWQRLVNRLIFSDQAAGRFG